MSTSQSKRPKRLRAGLMELGLLVAAMTTAFEQALRLGKQLRNNATFNFSIGLEIPVEFCQIWGKKFKPFHALVQIDFIDEK